MARVDVRANTMDMLQEFKREVGVEFIEVLKKNRTIFGDDFIMLSSTSHAAAAPSALSENSSSSSGLNSGKGGILSQSQQPQPINLGFLRKVSSRSQLIWDFIAMAAAAAN